MKNSKKKVAGGAVVVVVVVVVVAFDEKSIDYGNAMPAYANEEPATTPGRHLGRTRVFFIYFDWRVETDGRWRTWIQYEGKINKRTSTFGNHGDVYRVLPSFSLMQNPVTSSKTR